MIDAVSRRYWRVGYHADPLGFIPHDLCHWSLSKLMVDTGFCDVDSATSCATPDPACCVAYERLRRRRTNDSYRERHPLIKVGEVDALRAAD